MYNKFYLEIRSGVGGIEATLFSNELFDMYVKFLRKHNIQYEVLDMNKNGNNGIKDAIILIQHNIDVFRYEAGTHRVQRISKTEKKEKRHTSTATVAIIPLIEKKKFVINESDIEIQTFKAQGCGGQHINKTESAVRIIHKKTNITVVCQDERSQHMNKAKALDLLYSRLNDLMNRTQHSLINKERKEQVKNGDRSESVRTYNFIRSEVVNHYNNKKGNLNKVLSGSFDLLF